MDNFLKCIEHNPVNPKILSILIQTKSIGCINTKKQPEAFFVTRTEMGFPSLFALKLERETER